MTVKGNHPLAEVIARKLTGIDTVPPLEQQRMVSRAARAAVEYVERSYGAGVESERDRLWDALQDIADLQNHPQDVEIALAALEEKENPEPGR